MQRVVESLVGYLFKGIIKNEQQKEIYIYGLTLFLTTLLGFISILCVAAILDVFYQGIVFLIIFSLLRIHSGGYHCKTYAKCFVVSNLIFLAVFMIYKGMLYISLPAVAFIDLVLFMISWSYIVFNAPVLTRNHKLSKKRVFKNRHRAIVLASLITIIGCICTCFFVVTNNILLMQYCTIVSITEAAVAVLMLVLKIKERRNENA